jgi:GNAT superfamily N-acetyltransferase
MCGPCGEDREHRVIRSGGGRSRAGLGRVTLPDVEIRAATVDDLAELLRLYEVLADGRPGASPADPELGGRILATAVVDPNRTVLVAATGDGCLVGTVDLLVVPNLTRAGRPWGAVENVVVDDTARRHGVGTRLMDEVRRRAAAAGCYKLQLLSNKRRAEAHAFYEAAGFEAVAEGFRLYLV